MFDLKTASKTIRTIAASYGIKSGKCEPVNAGRSISGMDDGDAVMRVSNRNHPDGINITAGDIRYAEQYMI